MEFYRYEHPVDFKGPYTSRGHHTRKSCIQNGIYKMQKSHIYGKGMASHPSPQHDIPDIGWDGHYYKGDCLYGAKDLPTLRQWFSGFNKKLLRAGFNVVKYEVDERLDGKLHSAIPISTKVHSKEIVECGRS